MIDKVTKHRINGAAKKKLWPPARGYGFNLLIGYVGLNAGIFLMADPVASGRLDHHLPPWVVFLWGFELTLGCGAMIIGLIFNRILLEKLGLLLLLPASLVYAVLLGFVLGPYYFFNGIPYLLFVYACWDRLKDIRALIKAVTANG